MTNEQKQTIQDLRGQGQTFTQIADTLGLPRNTVKSFCQRGQTADSHLCRFCGSKLSLTPKAKKKQFCNDSCRYRYWNRHRDETPRRNPSPVVCIHCGVVFESHGNAHRKYCGRVCYINHRFGEVPVRADGAVCAGARLRVDDGAPAGNVGRRGD